MPTQSLPFIAFLAAWGSLAVAAVAAEREGTTITTQTLLEEMTDRDALTRIPDPYYRCGQFSSYDRDSTGPLDDGWYANLDRSQWVRAEENEGRTEYVLMDADGPGAIVRVWMTWHGPGGGEFSDGTLRLYLDHAETPAWEGPVSEFVDRGGLVGPPLSQGVSEDAKYAHRGHNLYLPIPYAEHCKVTYSTDVLMDQGAVKGEALYYHINYRTYDQGVAVESFSKDRLRAAAPVVERTQALLKESSTAPRGDTSKTVSDTTGNLAPGETAEVLRFDGPGAIRTLSLKLNAKQLPQALRSTILKIEFDGEPTVWAPAGDFFGIGYKIRPCETWYTAVSADRQMTCFWVMPYEKSAKISLHNLGEQDVQVELCEAETGDWSWDARSMHFHSTWKQFADLETRTNEDAGDSGAFDIGYVQIEGPGVYVGDTLTLFNGINTWWGEGDEKIYVDGERFPSHFGTGTEDYYGYAWCRPENFTAPFHSQPEGGGNLAGGYSVNSRYRSLDAIPFRASLDFDMEVWHWSPTTMDFAPTTFFYARPGAKVDVEPMPSEAMRTVKLRKPARRPPVLVEGALEAEQMPIVETTGGTAEIQPSPAYGWSGDRQLWWIDGNIGDRLTVSFPAPKAGKYVVVANLTKANDYARVRVTINGSSADEVYDRYNPSVSTDKIELGVFDLKEKENSLTFEIEGANPAAIERYMVGLDYLLLELASTR